MYNAQIQKSLAEKYANARASRMVKKAFDQKLVEALQLEPEEDTEEFASLLFVDITSFSSRIQGFSPRMVRKYLDDYYHQALSAIYERGGHVDRIAGDGILAVFSPYLPGKLDQEACCESAIDAAEVIVSESRGTRWSSKAAVVSGEVLFCATGLTSVYEDYTIIGAPITVAYRLEEKASDGQVLIVAQCAVGEYAYSRYCGFDAEDPPTEEYWRVKVLEFELRGIGRELAYVEHLVAGH